MISQAQQKANEFAQACKESGFEWSVNEECTVVTIANKFTPNDKEAFFNCEAKAFRILSLAPLKGGSIWGTDGLSVGGYFGLTKGIFQLKKSGEGKRFMTALRKITN